MDRDKFRNCLERAFVVIALVIYTRVILFLFFFTNPGESNVSTASIPLLMLIYVGVYCVTALLIATRVRQIVSLLLQEKFVLLLLVLAALSAAWSIAPGHTLSRTVALGGSALFGLYFAISFDRSQQLKLLGLAFYIILGLSLAAVLLLPDVAIMRGEHEGLWRGIFAHKNTLGKMAALGTLVFFLLAIRKPGNGSRHWPGFWLALAILVMSCSKSALLSYVILFCAISGYLASMRVYKPAAIALLSVLITSSSLVWQIKEGVFAPVVLSGMIASLSSSGDLPPGETPRAGPERPDMEKLLTGTGRKRLWSHLWKAVKSHPWLGHGFGGFWLGESGPSAAVMRDINWDVSIRSTHNGFLGLLLELGFTGLFLYVAGYSTALFRESGKLLRTPMDSISLFYPAVLAYIFLANIGESDLVSTNHIFWILFVAIATRSSWEARQQKQGSVTAGRRDA